MRTIKLTFIYSYRKNLVKLKLMYVFERHKIKSYISEQAIDRGVTIVHNILPVDANVKIYDII